MAKSQVGCRAKFRFLMGGLRAPHIEACERSSLPLFPRLACPFRATRTPAPLPPSLKSTQCRSPRVFEEGFCRLHHLREHT